ncbi:MAG TPA: SIS domain-containing protein [bacterium]
MAENFLGFSEADLIASCANFTAREISQQPELWEKTYELALSNEKSISSFLQNIFSLPNLDIIFSGAGTSAFIGNSLKVLFQKNTQLRTRSIATTDIVTHPDYYFSKQNPTLLISFARSGDSPESIAAFNLANQFCDSIYHLIITCNQNGRLATNANNKNSLVIVLPPEANDQGLAMTGSFTSMLLMAILISKINHIESVKQEIINLCRYGRKIIGDYAEQLKSICGLPFERAVFLGSGALMGCAEECHLKLQELTDGHVISKFDSFLGFRHGPKAVINPKTLMVYLFSNDPYVIQYEKDLLQSINGGERGLYSIAVTEDDQPDIDVNFKIILNSTDDKKIDPDFLPVYDVLVGQMLGFYKSLQLGLQPDTPSKSGTITRVVKGVKIYKFEVNKVTKVS